MNSKLVLLPFANRNVTQVIDYNGSDLVAYGSRSCIYFVKLESSPAVVLDSKVLRNTHRGKVLSVSFCKLRGNEFLGSIGEDCSLNIWDLENSTRIASVGVKECSRIVEWLYGSENSMVFPDTNGCVSKWNFRTNNLIRMRTCSESQITTLSSSKTCPELLAAGHTVGSISILDMNNLSLLHKLRTHSSDITSLSWSLTSPRMLLSASLDQTARVWNLEENIPVKTFNYPKTRFKDDKRNLRICAVFHPEDPDVIICSNVRGDIGEVLFQENEAPKFTPYDGKDSDTGFKSTNTMMLYMGENNEKQLLLSADHLKISLWRIKEQKLVSSFTFVSGNIYDLALSTVNSNFLASSSGDGFLRIWNASEDKKIELTTIYIHSRVKIMSVSWHPVEDSIIAYGSDEGRVGIADVHKKRSLYSFETHHGNTVYTLQWAPCSKIKDSKEEFFLYSCGSGSVFIHELHKPKVKPVDLDTLITLPSDFETVQKSHSELSWKPDYTCLALGCMKGYVDLFDYEFNFLTRVTLQMKTVESLKWHPAYTFKSFQGSCYSSWLAAAGNDDNIQIFDASEVTNGKSELNLCKATKSLIGHKKRVSSVCWSPHTDGYLASASRDGTVLVWNVISSTIIANYPYHRDIVFAVQWSILDPDIIYSGGMDNCLKIWRISEQSQSAAPEKSQVVRNKTFRGKPKQASPKAEQNAEVALSNLKADSKDDQIGIPEVSEVQIEKEELVTEKTQKTMAEIQATREMKRSLFSGYTSKTKVRSLETVLKLTDLLTDELDSSDSENMTLISDKVTAEDSLELGFYCDQLTALKMLETKANIESKSGNFEKVSFLQLFSNNIEPLLTSAAEKKQLTDFLVSAAPTVSRAFYNEMCEKYAIQLVEEKKYMKASSYLLFCGKLHEAIKVLLGKGKIIEALAIAKARLPDSDPFLPVILTKVAHYFAIQRLIEYEAACYLALKEPLQAAKVLSSAADSKYIYASVYICKKFKLEKEAETYGYFCIEKCLAQNEWSTCYKVADEISSLKIYKVLVRVHELISIHLKGLKKEVGIVASKMFGVTGTKLQIWENKRISDSNVSFLPYVYDVIKRENLLPEDRESLEEIFKALDYMDLKRKKYEASTEAHVSVAIHLSQVIVASYLNDYDLVNKYFMKIFPTTYNVVFLPRVISWLLLPFDIYWCSNSDTLICENKFIAYDLNPFTEHFNNINISMCNKLATSSKSDLVEFTMSSNVLSNLSACVQQVLTALAKKTSEDGILLYFSICYLSELRKLAKHGWKFRCYNCEIPCNKNVDETIHENGSILAKCDNNGEEKNIVFISDVQKQAEECQVTLKSECVQNKNQDSASIVDKDVLGIFPPELDVSTKNKIAQHHGWANFSELENKVMNNALIDEVNDTIDQKCMDDLNMPASPVKTPKNIDCEIEKTVMNGSLENCKIDVNEMSLSSDNIDDKIRRDESPDDLGSKIENGLPLENADGEIKENGDYLNNNINKVTEKETLLEGIDNKIEESETHIIGKIEENEIASEDEFDHLQCWSDISLYYVITKHFFSVTCKDEYALLYYLQNMLFRLDNTIADLARQQSVNLVSGYNQQSNISEKNAAKDTTESGNIPKENSNAVKCANILERDEVNQPRTGDIINGANFERTINSQSQSQMTNEMEIDIDNKDSTLVDETNIKLPNEDSGENLMSKENEIKLPDESIEKSKENGVSNKDVRKVKRSEETQGNNIENEEYDVAMDATQITNQKMVSEELQDSYKKITEQINLLKSEELYYPNPFDALSNLNGICCDIFRKHPCKFIKNKFHELAHQINKWNLNFCMEEKSVKCDICNVVLCT